MSTLRREAVNERIKELAEQAGYTKDMFGVGHWDMPECKKFAELIVEKCVSTLEFHGFEDAVPYIKWMAANKLGVKP